ncbi:MAG: hypothetical protein NVS3B7_10090 [Candidatus Elarobacter sp.]
MSDSTQGTAPSTQQSADDAQKSVTATDDAPKFVTAEDVAKIVNQAISARNKSFESKVEKSLADATGTLGAKFEEFAAKVAPPPKVDQPASASDGAPKVEEHPAFRSLQKQLSELRNKAERVEQERDAERAKTREASMRQRVQSALAEHGVDPKYAKHALGHLVDATKLVRLGEDGESLIFRDAEGADIDFATGLKSWVASDEAKIYLPPRGAAGSGANPQHTSAGRGNAPPDPRETLAQLLLQRGQ